MSKIRIVSGENNMDELLVEQCEDPAAIKLRIDTIFAGSSLGDDECFEHKVKISEQIMLTKENVKVLLSTLQRWVDIEDWKEEKADTERVMGANPPVLGPPRYR